MHDYGLATVITTANTVSAKNMHNYRLNQECTATDAEFGWRMPLFEAALAARDLAIRYTIPTYIHIISINRLMDQILMILTLRSISLIDYSTSFRFPDSQQTQAFITRPKNTTTNYSQRLTLLCIMIVEMLTLGGKLLLYSFNDLNL